MKDFQFMHTSLGPLRLNYAALPPSLINSRPEAEGNLPLMPVLARGEGVKVHAQHLYLEFVVLGFGGGGKESQKEQSSTRTRTQRSCCSSVEPERCAPSNAITPLLVIRCFHIISYHLLLQFSTQNNLINF